MRLRRVMTATFTGFLMAGLAWAPPADAWGRPGYRFGSPPPPFSTVTPFGSPDDPRVRVGPPLWETEIEKGQDDPRVRVGPRSPWAPPAGYRFYGYRPYSPGLYPRSRPYLYWERPFYRDRYHD